MADKTPYIDSAAFYESLVDNMLDGLAYCQMIFDPQGHPVDFIYLKVSKNFEKLTGLKEPTGKKVTDLIPGITTSNPELFELYGRVSLNRRSERFETYVAPLSRWFLVSAYSPKKEFFVALFQNITDRKRIEKDLKNSKIAARNVLEDLQSEKEELNNEKAKDEAILSSIGDAVMACDTDGKVMLFNSVAEAISGYSKDEAIGNHHSEVLKFIRESDGKPAVDFISKAIKTGQKTGMGENTFLVTKNGKQVPIADSAAPIKDPIGKTIGCVIVFHDVSKEREIDKLKDDFVNIAAHDLRTPATVIKGYLSMILEGEGGGNS